MKRKIHFLLIGLILIVCIGSLDLSAEFYKLHNSQGQAEMPFIHVLKNGDIMVLYVEGHHFNSDSTLFQTIYSKELETWGPKEQVVKKVFSTAFPQIAEDPEGDLHMTFWDGNASSNREIYYMMYDYDAAKWSGRRRAYESPGLNSTWPRIRFENNNIFIIWTHNYQPSIGLTDLVMIVNEKGGEWPIPNNDRITISDTGQSASVHNFFDIRDGKISVIWMDDNHKKGNWEMYYSEGSYAENLKKWTFTKYKHLWPTGNNQYYPALVMDDESNVHVIYSHKNGPFNYARKDAKTKVWSNPRSVSTSPTSFTLISYMVYRKGLLHTVIRQSTGNGEGMFYSRGLPSTGKWIKPVKLMDGLQFPGYPGVDVDDDGIAHVVFSDGNPDHPRHIFYGRVELPGKPPEPKIEASRYGGILPLEVTFDGKSSTDPDGNIEEYRWDFDDGTTALGKKVTHTFTEEGEFAVRLTAIDNDLLLGVAKVDIKATSGEPIAAIEADPLTGFAPLEVTFDASRSEDEDGEIVSYGWDLGDGTTSEEITLTHLYEHGGSYTVSLTVTDDDDKSDTSTVNIRIYEKPVADFTTNPPNGVIPLKVDLDASTSVDHDGTIEAYYWNFGDGEKGEGQIVSHVYSEIGEYLVTLVVIDNEGFIDSTSSKVITYDGTKVTAEFTSSVIAGVAPLTVDFNAKKSKAGSREIVAYKWNFGDGEIDRSKKVTHTFQNPGIYSVVLVVVDQFGYNGSASQIITVYEKPFAPLGIQVDMVENKSFFFMDYINRISWQGNSMNEGFFNIVQYRVYRKNVGETDDQFELITELNNATFLYEDRKFTDKTRAENSVYAITAVDDQGRESDLTKSGI